MIDRSKNYQIVNSEPSHRELERFKRKLLSDKQGAHGESNKDKELSALKIKIGGLEAYIEELEHKIKQAQGRMIHQTIRGASGKLLTGKKTKAFARHYLAEVLNQLLFLELKTGQLYT